MWKCGPQLKKKTSPALHSAPRAPAPFVCSSRLSLCSCDESPAVPLYERHLPSQQLPWHAVKSYQAFAHSRH